MQNRRNHFRYAFFPHYHWLAQLRTADGSQRVAAEVVDLSVGGICVKVEGEAAPHRRWIISLPLSTEGNPLQIPMLRVHGAHGQAGRWGFQFLPLANAAEQEEHERLISRFLLDAQRRDRQQATVKNGSSAAN